MSKYESSILVTGGTQGCGYYCSLALAEQCPNNLIVVASRTDPEDSAAIINKQLNQTNVLYMSLDLGTLAKVRDFAKRWKEAKHPPVRALVMNAGIQLPTGVQWTEDGIEKTFAINHVGHALLFHLLSPSLTPDARVVITASGVHDPNEKWGLTSAYGTSAEEVARPDEEAEKKSNGRDRYATSKAANIIWMYALARHFESNPATRGRTAVALDPGLMPGTGLTRNGGFLVRWISAWAIKLIPLMRMLIRSNIHAPHESGKTLAWLAVGEEAEGKTGVYYVQRKETLSSDISRVETTQEDLWRWTIDFVGQNREERERFERFE